MKLDDSSDRGMKRMCRESLQGQSKSGTWVHRIRYFRVIADPDRVAQLKAELERQKSSHANNSRCCHRIREEGSR